MYYTWHTFYNFNNRTCAFASGSIGKLLVSLIFSTRAFALQSAVYHAKNILARPRCKLRQAARSFPFRSLSFAGALLAPGAFFLDMACAVIFVSPPAGLRRSALKRSRFRTSGRNSLPCLKKTYAAYTICPGSRPSG